MNSSEGVPDSAPAKSPFTGEVVRALSGGAILLAGTLVSGVVVEARRGVFAVLFFWVSWAWLAFPVGAWLGCLLPRWAARRRSLGVIGLGLLVGVVAGLALAIAYWLCSNLNELIGLMTQRQGAGYASYSFSVRLHLRAQAEQALTGVAPVMVLWVIVWWAWTSVSARPIRSGPASTDEAVTVHLRLDRFVARSVGWVMASLAGVTLLGLLLVPLVERGARVSLPGVLLAVPVAAGLVVLGPWLGVLINPEGGVSVAWQLTWVGLPVLLAGLAPFALRRRPVRSGTAALAWSWLLTALLFWIAAGAFSLGWSLG